MVTTAGIGCFRPNSFFPSSSFAPRRLCPADNRSLPARIDLELMGFQEDVLAAYDEAARLYDWFDLAPMPLDESDSVKEGENTYFRVLDENITSTKELRSRLEEVFTSELAEEIFNKASDQYRDFDGKLYAIR